MSAKLRKLIAHYEAEKAALVAQRDECLAEQDYDMAQRFVGGLTRVYRQLQVIQQLQDPLHEEKSRTAERINRMEALLISNENANIYHSYQARLTEERSKLVALQDQSIEVNPAPRAVQMHESLDKLINRQISAFTLVIDPEQRLHCNFRLVRRTLLITLPEVRRHRANYLGA